VVHRNLLTLTIFVVVELVLALVVDEVAHEVVLKT
jgi:hypothetical protein